MKTLTCSQSVEETSVVVPARSYAELMRVLGDTDEPVDIILAQAKNQVIFRVDTTEVVSRLIDGQFPNYQSVLPTSHSTRAVVDRDELLKAVRISALIAQSAANVVRLRFGEDGAPTASRRRRRRHRRRGGPGRGELEGDPVTIAFNARYLLEALQNMDDDQLAIELAGPLAPGVLKPRRRPLLRPRDHAGAHAILSGRPPPAVATAHGTGPRTASGPMSSPSDP